MTQQTEREKFEAWARAYGTWEVTRDDVLGATGYTDITLTVAWHAVQDRTALEAKQADANQVDLHQIKKQAVLSEPWGHCVSGRVFVSRELPEHIRPLVESGELNDMELYTADQLRALLAEHGITVCDANQQKS